MRERPDRHLRAITLDGQLLGYWAREAARLDAIAGAARFGWQRRRFARKAAEARARAERFAAREDERGAEPDLSQG